MIIGIDLGTTNSLVAVWRDGKSVLIPNALGQFITPSVVGFDDVGGILVGQPAKDRLITHPLLTAANFKRYMGSHHQQRLGDRLFRPEELSALLLKSLKQDAEAWLGEPVEEAVITVPAYFNDAQRKATKIAGELAGLRVERLLNEPTAAALAYGLHEQQERKFLVFDLGGGTFDVSILDLFEAVMEVRATAGDNRLGGEDFNDIIGAQFYKQAPVLQELTDPGLHAQLRRLSESFKRRLGENAEVNDNLDWLDEKHAFSLNQEQLEQICAPLLARLREPVERALRDARLKSAELDQVVLVGGATRMPLVRKLVARMFGRFPVCTLNPDEVVAMGAAVQAGLKQRDASLEEIVLTDVAPYSLGVEVSDRWGDGRIERGLFLPIIERNTLVPVSRTKVVETMHDHQEVLLVAIYQGEARKVNDNIFLGQLEIPVPVLKAGEAQLEVRFTYTVDGILETECTVLNTGFKQSLVIEKNPGVLSEHEVRLRLAALEQLKLHPRDHIENTALLSRANRLYEQTRGDLRQFVGQHIGQFEAVLATQDPILIRDARKDLTRLFNDIEGDVWL